MTETPERPLVSIVIPTYDRPDWLRGAIRSALWQSYAEIEVVVVDDCGSSATAAVVGEFADARLRYHRHARRQGLVANHGSGLLLARGEFVGFLADDDIWLPDFVARRANELLAHPQLVVVFSGSQMCDDEVRVLHHIEPALPAFQPLGSRELLGAVLSRTWSINSSLYQRRVLLDLWPRLAASGNAFDLALNLRIAIRGEGVGMYLPGADILYRQHARQTSRGEAALAHFQEGGKMYESALGEPIPPDLAALIRRDFAMWQAMWGRELARAGDLRSARRHFAQAIALAPRWRGGWTQMGAALLCPWRFRSGSSRLTTWSRA